MCDVQSQVQIQASLKELIFKSLHVETPKDCYVCPEPSKLFPTLIPSAKIPVLAGLSQTSSVPFTREKCEFFVAGGLRWLVTIMGNGVGVTDYLDEFKENSSNGGAAIFVDYAVVDICTNATGAPSEVPRHAHRMTVFFKDGDFRQCTVVCGLDFAPEVIELKNSL